MSKKASVRPAYRSPSGRFILWPDIIRHARRSPGVWWLVFPDVPEATALAVRYRKHPDLKRDDGRLEADLRNIHITGATGHRRGDLYIRWIPREEEA